MQPHRQSNLLALLIGGDAAEEAANDLRRRVRRAFRNLALAASALKEFIQDVRAAYVESEDAMQIPERDARERLHGKLWD